MSIALPDWAPPARWPWLGGIVTARRLLALALIIGLLSIATVADLTVQCRDKRNYILSAENGSPIMLEDGSGFLVTEEKSRVCRISAGRFSIFTF